MRQLAAYREAGRRARERVERRFTWDHYLHRFNAALADAGIPLADRAMSDQGVTVVVPTLNRNGLRCNRPFAIC